MKVLVTGSAGFIGYFFSKKMIEEGFSVVGIDNLNNYYDVNLKLHRNGKLLQNAGTYTFHKLDIADRHELEEVFETYEFEYVINLAAQAGVRYSLENPYAYMDSNLAGFLNVLECCRHYGTRHLVFASSSSVYGMNKEVPFAIRHNVDHPVSLYAATKKSNELMAHCYAHLYKIPVTGLRFFTVYGPMGRPDMAYYKFTDAIVNGRPIDVYNNGNMERDFTYIDDIVEGIFRTCMKIPDGKGDETSMSVEPESTSAPYKLYNIGNNKPVKLLEFIGIIEKVLGREAKKNFLPMQPGDVLRTYADIDDLVRDTGYGPSTPIEKGIGEFVSWYKEYYEL